MLTSDGADWKIGRTNKEEYKESLFSEKRLDQRELLFKNITLPSIANQESLNPEEFTLLVLTSDQLPEKSFENLLYMLKPYSWAKAIRLPNDDTMINLIDKVIKVELSVFKEEVCYSTIRLDDDDALTSNFLSSFNKYINPEYVGFCISYGKGYTGIINDKIAKFESFHENYSPKIALGLSFINTFDPKTNTFGNENISIFSNGSHTKVDQSSPTILDSVIPMYLRTIHPLSDTNSIQQLKKYKDKPKVSPTVIEEKFKINLGVVTWSEILENEVQSNINNELERKINQYDKIQKELHELMGVKEQLHEIVTKNQEKLKNTKITLDLGLENLKTQKIRSDELEKECIVLQKQLKEAKENHSKVSFEKEKAKKKLEKIQKSRWWRYTTPIRSLLDFLKGKKPEQVKKNEKNSNNRTSKKTPNLPDNLKQQIDQAKQNGKIISYLDILNKQRKQNDFKFITAYQHAAKQYKKESNNDTKMEVYKKVLEGLNVNELPEFIIKETEKLSLPIKQVSSFKLNMNIRSRKRNFGEFLPEWKLNDKKSAYDFIDELKINRPWTSEEYFTINELPKQENIVIKPAEGAASRGVYIIKGANDILDVSRSKNVENWLAMEKSMRDDLELKRVEKDKWIVEEFIYEDDDRTPARDYKFLTFYGKVALVTEICRFPKNKHCWWNRDGKIVSTGVFEKTRFEGEGITKEMIEMVEKLSLEIPAPFMRIDFLKTKEGLVFGEFTPRPGTYSKFDEETDRMLGDYFLEAEVRLNNDLLNGKEFVNFHNYLLKLSEK